MNHADRNADPDLPDLIENLLHNVGRACTLMRTINNLEWDVKINGPNIDNNNALVNLNNELDTIIGNMPDPEALNNIQLTDDADTFFEVLTQCIMNSLKSFQGWLNKLVKAKKADLMRRLDVLKSNFVTNTNDIFQLERELNDIVDKDLNDKIASLKIVENLNAEKPTLLFLNLTKNRSCAGLEKIKKPDGSPFDNEADRHFFIYDSYKKLFQARERAPLPDNCIDQFLGPAIAESEMVQNSKLTNDETPDLESPLTIEELDASAKKGKLRSAPGADGYSNYLIQKCWKFLRFSLLKYCEFCFTTGNLTHKFRSARIWLIPKKGDTSLLKNWRPISLLSNLYKILSRAINSRLNKVVNRICSTSQKGYNNSRYTQEVLINTWENIHFCRKNDIKGAVVAIDMAKAFDTLSHDYVNHVYRFFRFGPNMIRWLNLNGNHRVACISFGPGNDSAFFDLGQGRPQGDNVSPNSFNFCAQPLIFKIELDPGVVPVPRIRPQLINQPNDFFRLESNHETSKNESLADDNTTLTIFERQSLT
jgi:Reverse transcriptase (RNA-dependent DNA polymerase)